jgi:hypothetical protein
MTQAARNGTEAAKALGIPQYLSVIESPQGCRTSTPDEKGEPITGGQVRFRGRAVVKLAEGVPRQPWSEFVECPDEDFSNPGRVHVDAFGNVHLCQGVLMGNLWQQPLKEIVAGYDPAAHPIIGPLVDGGPVALVKRYGLPHEDSYVDACHLCYFARDQLRHRFPELLGPPTVYGEL